MYRCFLFKANLYCIFFVLDEVSSLLNIIKSENTEAVNKRKTQVTPKKSEVLSQQTNTQLSSRRLKVYNFRIV